MDIFRRRRDQCSPEEFGALPVSQSIVVIEFHMTDLLYSTFELTQIKGSLKELFFYLALSVLASFKGAHSI